MEALRSQIRPVPAQQSKQATGLGAEAAAPLTTLLPERGEKHPVSAALDTPPSGLAPWEFTQTALQGQDHLLG